MDNYTETCSKCNGYGWVNDTTLQGYHYCNTCDKTGEVTTKEDTQKEKING